MQNKRRPMKEVAVITTLSSLATCVVIGAALLGETGVLGGALLGLFIGLIVSLAIDRERMLGDMRSKDFHWYKAQYPNAQMNGRVTCHNCGGDRINVRHLMNRTYLRAHFCPQCGETLYYSNE